MFSGERRLTSQLERCSYARPTCCGSSRRGSTLGDFGSRPSLLSFGLGAQDEWDLVADVKHGAAFEHQAIQTPRVVDNTQ
jgi:hypothetical protein